MYMVREPEHGEMRSTGITDTLYERLPGLAMSE